MPFLPPNQRQSTEGTVPSVPSYITLVIFTCVVEYVPSNCFIQRFRAAVSVLVGPCCPTLLNCIDVDAHTVVLLGK